MDCTICHTTTGYPSMLDIDVCDHCQTIIDMLDDWELAVLGDRIRKQLTARVVDKSERLVDRVGTTQLKGMKDVYVPTDGVLSTRTLDSVDGFDLVAYEVFDEDSSPIGEELENGGCFTAEDIEAWRSDEWYFAGVVVVAYRAGIPLGSSALWGCETGNYWDRGDVPYRELLEGVEFAYTFGPDLIDEALAQARETIAELVKG